MMWKTVCLLAVCGVLACSAPGRAWADTALDYQPFGEELAAFLDGQAGVYGVYLIDLNSGASLGYNEKETFHGASTFKVPLNLYLFEQVAAGRVNPDGYLMYREAHYEEGTGYLHKEEFGTYFRIERLARDSIVYSDNVATNMLLGYVGRRNVTAHMRALGGTAVSDQANVTCAADLALYFQGVLEFARRQPVHGERLLGYLRNTVHGDRIPQSLPAKIPVAHKTGDWPAQRSWHDAGIVEHPIRPYILAVLSKNTPGYVYACATIREVSRRVYEYQSDPFFHLTVYIDGQPVELSGALNRDGRFLVPVRAFVDLLAGYTVRWLPEDRAVLILDAEGRISARLTVDSSGLVLHRGRTYLPSRQAGEILGYTVRWDPNNLTVYFTAGQTGLSDAGEAAGSGETEESTGDEETEAQPENRGGGQNFQESLELASTSG